MISPRPSHPSATPAFPFLADGFVAACALGALLGACSSAAKRVPLDVPAARAPSAATRIADDVARLLGADPPASEDAARRLSGLDEDGRTALAAHAKSIPSERDPRWLTVLDGNGLLVDEGPAVRARLLAWQASRREPALVWRAQNGLLELARTHPEILERALADASWLSRDAIAIALADARSVRSIPSLVGLYREARSGAERRSAALALGRLVGDDRRPRLDPTAEERERDSERVLAWFRANGGGDARR